MSESNEVKNVILKKNQINKETIKRLIGDITNIHKNPLHDLGIYYLHNDTNMLEGRAMIIGPDDTPYEKCFFFFKFEFPYNYPHEPPKVTFCNYDGVTRFNPNLYRNGKVCLSILNTWRGEGWTSCQTIRSVLLTLITTLNETPILNEPGVRKDHPDYHTYHEFINLKSLEVACIDAMKEENINEYFTCFYHVIKDHILENKEKYQSMFDGLTDKFKHRYSDTYDNKPQFRLITQIYGMNAFFDLKKIQCFFKNNLACLMKN